MSNAVTLDSIRAAAEAKYGSYDIEGVRKPDSDETITVSLLNPLRMSKEDRNALVDLQKELSADEDDEAEGHVDQEELLAKAIRLTARNSYEAEALLAEVGDDLAMLAAIFEGYSEGTQVGEASASAA